MLEDCFIHVRKVIMIGVQAMKNIFISSTFIDMQAECDLVLE